MTESSKSRQAFYFTLFCVVCGLSLLLFLQRLSLPREEPPGMGSATYTGETLTSMEEEMERLRAIPYATHTEKKTGSLQSGVVLHDPEKAWPGYNLYCSRLEPEAYLLDMNGAEVHRWTYPMDQGEPRLWDHVVLLPDGELLALLKFTELIRLDWQSNLRWQTEIAVHHDLAVAPDQSLFVLLATSRDYRGLQTAFDQLGHLSPTGKLLDRWDSFERLADLKRDLHSEIFLDTVMDRYREQVYRETESQARADTALAHKVAALGGAYDYFHLNSVQVLPDTELGRGDARFQPGNLLLCMRNVNQIVVLEKETYTVRWAWGHAELQHPHHATLLAGGRILLFDNGVERRYSRVLEVDPLSGKIDWEYRATPPETFYSFRKGSAQRLANGNTLICSGDEGRVFEITRAGERVWEWLNPAVEEGRRATLYRMTRIDRARIAPLIR